MDFSKIPEETTATEETPAVTAETNNGTFQEARTTYMDAVEDHILDLQTDPEFNLNDGYTRFSELVNPHFFKDAHFVIIGCGGLGNPTFKTIMNMGAQHVTLIDDDVVGIENMASQDHDVTTIGQLKVNALRDWALRHCGVEINTAPRRVDDWLDIQDAVGHKKMHVCICCVDNMDLRNSLSDSYHTCYTEGNILRDDYGYLPNLYIDTRMSAGTSNLFVHPKTKWVLGRHVMATNLTWDDIIFEDTEGVQEPCTARATVFTGYSLGAYIGAFMAWYSNNFKKFDEDVSFTKSFYDMECANTPFKYNFNFDAFGFKAITPEPSVIKLQKNYAEVLKSSMQDKALCATTEEAFNSMLNMVSASSIYASFIFRDEPCLVGDAYTKRYPPRMQGTLLLGRAYGVDSTPLRFFISDVLPSGPDISMHQVNLITGELSGPDILLEEHGHKYTIYGQVTSFRPLVPYWFAEEEEKEKIVAKAEDGRSVESTAEFIQAPLRTSRTSCTTQNLLHRHEHDLTSDDDEEASLEHIQELDLTVVCPRPVYTIQTLAAVLLRLVQSLDSGITSVPNQVVIETAHLLSEIDVKVCGVTAPESINHPTNNQPINFGDQLSVVGVNGYMTVLGFRNSVTIYCENNITGECSSFPASIVRIHNNGE